MRFRFQLLVILGLLAWLPFFGTRAQACTCIKVPPAELYATSDVVFIGTVIRQDFRSYKTMTPSSSSGGYAGPTEIPVTLFRVEESFFGVKGRTEIEVAGTMTTCDVNFKDGERYVVFASWNAKQGRLFTTICDGTGTLDRKREEIKYLRSPAAKKPGVVFSGTVRQEKFDSQTGQYKILNRPGVSVFLENEKSRFVARTDRQGKFRMEGIPAGRYTIRTDPPSNQGYCRGEVDNPDQDISNPPPQERWTVDFPDHGAVSGWFSESVCGVISGRLVDETGQGVAGRDIRLDFVTPRPDWNFREMQTDEEGRFTYWFLPPGQYVLGFNLGSPSIEHPYRPFFLPGVSERGAATVFTLNLNQRLTDLTFRMPTLPDRVPVHTLTGIAILANGQPARRVTLSLTNVQSGYREGNSVETSWEGKFSFRAVEGETYELKGLFIPNFPTAESKPLRIKVAKENPPIRFVIEPLSPVVSEPERKRR